MSVPVHPFLVAAFPILFLAQENLALTSPREALVPLAAAMVGVAVLLAVGARVLRDARKAALLVSVAAILFFSYGHVYDLIEGKRIGGLIWGRELFLAPVWAVIALLTGVVVLRSKRTFADLTRVFNVMGAGLLAVTLVSLGLRVASNQVTSGASGGGAVARAAEVPSYRPDIYYLIFDRYGGASSLREFYGFDNSPFLASLRERGFYVAGRSRTNYPNTSLSLASSMNMTYLDVIDRRLGGAPSGTLSAAWDMIHHSQAARFLKARGYRFVNIGSWWDPTARNPEADVSIELDDTSEFTRTFFASTALRPLMERGALGEGDVDLPPLHRRIALRQFETIKRVSSDRGPKFVFMHVLLPHPPFVFDRHGNAVYEEENLDASRDIRNYDEQLRYTNTRILETVDHLLAGPRGERPVVIVQADEGPHPLTRPGGLPDEWLDRPDSMYREKFPILNALYFPRDRPELYDTMTPVNTFRMLFDTYFDADLPPLPDHSYVSRSKADLYSFVEIDDRLASP